MLNSTALNAQRPSLWPTASFEANYCSCVSKLVKAVTDLFFRMIGAIGSFCSTIASSLASRVTSTSLTEEQKACNENWIKLFTDREAKVGPAQQNYDAIIDKTLDDRDLQFLFPATSPTRDARPVLTPELVEQFNSSYDAKHCFLGFLTGYLKKQCQLDMETRPGEIQIDQHLWELSNRENWMVKDSPAFKRFTQILKCLTALGLDSHAKLLYQGLMKLDEQQAQHGRCGVIDDGELNDWYKALSPNVQQGLTPPITDRGSLTKEQWYRNKQFLDYFSGVGGKFTLYFTDSEGSWEHRSLVDYSQLVGPIPSSLNVEVSMMLEEGNCFNFFFPLLQNEANNCPVVTDELIQKLQITDTEECLWFRFFVIRMAILSSYGFTHSFSTLELSKDKAPKIDFSQPQFSSFWSKQKSQTISRITHLLKSLTALQLHGEAKAIYRALDQYNQEHANDEKRILTDDIFIEWFGALSPKIQKELKPSGK